MSRFLSHNFSLLNLKLYMQVCNWEIFCNNCVSFIANECLVLILKLAQSHSKDALDELMLYVDLLQSRNANLYESHIISILKVMIRFVKSVGTYLPVKFVTKLFSVPSLTRQLRLSPSSSVSIFDKILNSFLFYTNIQDNIFFYDIFQKASIIFLCQ